MLGLSRFALALAILAFAGIAVAEETAPDSAAQPAEDVAPTTAVAASATTSSAASVPDCRRRAADPRLP